MYFIEIFKTNVLTESTAAIIIRHLNCSFPEYQINFDLEDSDNIMRIDGGKEKVDVTKIILLLRERGFAAELLQ